jgi:hypothetical protein
VLFVSAESTHCARQSHFKTWAVYEFKNVPPGEYRVTSRPNPGSGTRQYADHQLVTVEFGKTAEVRFVYR